MSEGDGRDEDDSLLHIYILADDPSSLTARPDINGGNRTEEWRWREARGDRGRQQQRSSTSDPSDLESRNRLRETKTTTKGGIMMKRTTRVAADQSGRDSHGPVEDPFDRPLPLRVGLIGSPFF